MINSPAKSRVLTKHKLVYGEAQAMTDYDNRITAVVQYVSLAFPGQRWLDLHDYIVGFDIQNEPWVNVLNANDPSNWLSDRADHLREQLGWDNPIKVCSGGVGGSWTNKSNLADWVLAIGHIDIVCIHYYNDPSGKEGETDWLTAARNSNKLVLFEEWTTDTENELSGADRNAQYQANAKALNDLGIAWLYWEALPSKTCDYNFDGDYAGIFVDDPSIDIATQMAGAANVTGAQDCEYKFEPFHPVETSSDATC